MPKGTTSSSEGATGQSAAIYAQRITAALPLMAAKRVSMHDCRGNAHWQSSDVWAPEDRDAVRMAIERFVGQTAPARASHELPGQRTAVLLRAAGLDDVFRGFVMIVMDNRHLRGKGNAFRDFPVPVQKAVHDWAMTLTASSLEQDASNDVIDGSAALSPVAEQRLLSSQPTVDNLQVDEYFARLRAFPLGLAAQALLPLQSGMRIKRYEVLLREGGNSTSDVAPISMLREADARGFGAVLDRRVAGALLAWLSGRRDAFTDEPSQFSLNLSSTTLADPHFLQFIELCIAKAGISPALLSFEVDQSVWKDGQARIEGLSQSLAFLGAGLVIDNCTLNESTPDLMSLPGVCLAKIDRSLTCDLAANRIAQMRIGAIAQIARIAGVHTVAKQVESAAEQELLRALGIDFVQGYGSAIPVTLDALDEQREAQVVIEDAGSELRAAG
jgi:EAL domain-containing protein (putative c-di-GMP-specific phosphodiesterase class I)